MMTLEFIYDSQGWLREYHSRSTAETVNPTLKRLFVVPLMKMLVERKATELLAGVVACNIRQLVYPKYTKGRHRYPACPSACRSGELDEQLTFCQALWIYD